MPRIRPITTKFAAAASATLLIKSGVTITQASGGDIVLNAKGDFTLRARVAASRRHGDVDIYADVDDVAPDGRHDHLLGPIIAQAGQWCTAPTRTTP